MENNFRELHSAITKEFLNTYLDLERNLMLHQPHWLIKENKWEIVPHTNEAKYLNDFYSFYPNGVEGTKEECLNLIKDYGTKK